MSKKHDSDSPFASLAEFGQSLKTELDRKAEADKARRAAEKKRALKADPAGGFSGIEAELMRHARSQGAQVAKGQSEDPDAVDFRKMEEKAKANVRAKASAAKKANTAKASTSDAAGSSSFADAFAKDPEG